MDFQVTPWMLMPLAMGIFASVILLNRHKVHEINKRWDERLNLPPRGSWRLSTGGNVALIG